MQEDIEALRTSLVSIEARLHEVPSFFFLTTLESRVE